MALINLQWNIITFIVVLLSGAFWPVMPPFLPWGMITFACLLYSYYFQKAKRLRAILWAIGIILIQANLLIQSNQYLHQYGENTTITGQVTSFFAQKKHGIFFQFKVSTINHHKLTFGVRPDALIFWPFESNSFKNYEFDSTSLSQRLAGNITLKDAPKLGENWQLNVKLKPIAGLMNQAGFDREKYVFSQGFTSDIQVAAHENNQQISPSKHWRFYIWEKVSPYILDRPYSGHLIALSFGRRDFLSSEDWEVLKQTGLAHLMAISGLHVGLALGFGWFLGRMLRLFSSNALRLQWLPLYFGLCFALFYAFLAGFSLPTQRALIMCLIFAGMRRFNLNYSFLQIFKLTLMTVLITQPFSYLQGGFWLSFGAVFYLWLCRHVMPDAIRNAQQWRKLKQVIWYQIFIVVGMAWLNLWLFQGVSLASPFLNAVFVPWTSFIIVPLIFLSLFLSYLSPFLAQLCWNLSHKAVAFLVQSAQIVEIGWWSPDKMWMIIATLPVILYLCYQFTSMRYFIGLGILYFALIIQPKCQSCWEVNVLDVGHGLAVLIGKDGKWMLYDTGDAWEGSSMVRQVILPVLKQKGIQQLDGIIISHQDKDHAGGLQELKLMMPDTWIMGSYEDKAERSCVAGKSWYWQGLQFKVLWPNQLVNRSHNPHSCVIMIHDEKNKVLLTGDIDAVAEYLILNQTPKHELKADVMLVPHHGSRTSSVIDFIQTVSPRWGLVSVKANNRWHLPSSVVVQRYQQNHVKLLSTAQTGQIKVKIRTNSIQIDTLRALDYVPWYRQMLRNRLE